MGVGVSNGVALSIPAFDLINAAADLEVLLSITAAGTDGLPPAGAPPGSSTSAPRVWSDAGGADCDHSDLRDGVRFVNLPRHPSPSESLVPNQVEAGFDISTFR